MSLRRKLLFGFVGLLMILAAAGYQGIVRVTRLGESIDVILRENFRSVLACQEMKEALDRAEVGALLGLLGEDGRGDAMVRESLDRFGRSLDVELGNITIPGEGERAQRLKRLFGQYRAAALSMTAPRADRASRQAIHRAAMRPLRDEIRGLADEIQRMNQASMLEMDRSARKRAASVRRQLYLVLAAVTLVTALFLYGTGRWILRPISRLIESTREIRQGNLDLVLPAHSRDEIGQLSESFNEMTATLRELRRSGQAKMLRIQRALQQAFDSLPEAIAVLDPGGRVEVSTAAARDRFGLKPEAYLADLHHDWIFAVVEKALRTGRPAQADGPPIQQFSGSEERFWLPRAIPILDGDKMPAGVVLLLDDVTRQREQDELKRGVISTVSHQLKTPLTSIRMAVHLLLGEKIGGLTEKQVEVLLAARDEADRLHRILEELLDISRIESGRAELAFRPVPPEVLALSAAAPCRAAALDRGVTLDVTVPADLPDVRVDPGRIGQVFENLVGNALRHTPPGGRVELSARADELFVRFDVSDNGAGIPGQYLSRLFEPFFRVPGQGAETGVGLGLSIVREIVEAHGGRVGAESREGEGSTFHFEIPRADRFAREEQPS